MASPGELVQVVAERLGVPEAVVVQHDRNLVIAGKRSKGGRGRSAAKVTAEDAANLLIAVAASNYVKDTISTLETYGSLKAYQNRTELHSREAFKSDGEHGARWQLDEMPIAALRDLPRGHTFAEGLTALICSMVDKSFEKAGQYLYDLPPLDPSKTIYKDIFGDVEFVSPWERSAIVISTHRFVESIEYHPYQSYSDGKPTETRSDNTAYKRKGGLNQRRDFSFNTLFAVSDCIRN